MYASYKEHCKKYGEDQTQIDRVSNTGNYTKENCKWATRTEQCNNTRRNTFIEFNGTKRTVSEWARTLHVPPTVITMRLRRGWSGEKALSPFKHGSKSRPTTEHY
jgi:hypothetical protein